MLKVSIEILKCFTVSPSSRVLKTHLCYFIKASMLMFCFIVFGHLLNLSNFRECLNCQTFKKRQKEIRNSWSRKAWSSSCKLSFYCLVGFKPGNEEPKPLPRICLSKIPTICVWHHDCELDKVCMLWVLRAHVAQLSWEWLCSHYPWNLGLTKA